VPITATDLDDTISKILKVFRQGAMKNSSQQFGAQFLGFDRQHGKFRRIGTCIRHNFGPWRVWNNGKKLKKNTAAVTRLKELTCMSNI